ncbi:MAG: hypothetical protein ACOC70_01560 [bacterium]
MTMGDVSGRDRTMYLDRALKAADWYVNSQLNQCEYGDEWHADRGRFLYHYYMPEKKHTPGINWTQGRALFVLSEACKITGDERYRDAAELGYRYVAALQVMDPGYPQIAGAIKEETPQCSRCGALDGAQAASGLLMFEKVTGNADALRRARAFCDYLLRHFDDESGLPALAYVYPEEKVVHVGGYARHAIGQCTAIPCWHLYRRTGEEKYLEPVVWGADFILDCQRDDGAFHNVKDIARAEPPRPNHHEGRGEGDHRYVLYNDDGMIVIILAAHLATGDDRYLDAAVRYADWIVGQPVEERPFCAFPVRANTVLDVGRLAGKDYSAWVLDHLQEHVLDLQVEGSGDPKAEGGFRGEDEEDEGGIYGGTSLDYVTNRVTCYAAGLLFRLSGRGTGAGFSPWGLED